MCITNACWKGLQNASAPAVRFGEQTNTPHRMSIGMKLFNVLPGLARAGIAGLLSARSPLQLVVQLTDRCNARCPQCGMRSGERFPRSTLDTGFVKQIIDRFASFGGAAISFTGGEPLMIREELIELIRHAGDRKIPHIRTGTNGYIFRDHESAAYTDGIHRLAHRLAETGLSTFWISIDSASPKTHEAMRGLPGVIRGIEKALPVFESFGIYPSANLGINRNTGLKTIHPMRDVNDSAEYDRIYDGFRHAFRSFYRLVRELGFTIVNSCYPMSVDPHDGDLSAVYGASSSDNIIRFTSGEKTAVYQALFDTIPEFREKLRIFSPRSSLYSLILQHRGENRASYPCRGGIDYFFISAADGAAYPCGYRGSEKLGDFREMDLKEIRNTPFCTLCDWECFRDPSELIGPILEFRENPAGLVGKMRRDSVFMNLWREDLAYYKACSFFNGRTKPDYRKMSRFGTPS